MNNSYENALCKPENISRGVWECEISELRRCSNAVEHGAGGRGVAVGERGGARLARDAPDHLDISRSYLREGRMAGYLG